MGNGYTRCVYCFFWNIEQLHPRITKAVGLALPMQTITTEPDRYRKEFLKYVFYPVTVQESSSYCIIWNDG